MRGIHYWQVDPLKKGPYGQKPFHVMMSLCCHDMAYCMLLRFMTQVSEIYFIAIVNSNQYLLILRALNLIRVDYSLLHEGVLSMINLS